MRFCELKWSCKTKSCKTGIQDDTNIEITSGLKKGEEIITGPYTMVSKELTSNDKVKVESTDFAKK